MIYVLQLAYFYCGLSPLHVAREMGYTEIVDALVYPAASLPEVSVFQDNVSAARDESGGPPKIRQKLGTLL